MLFFRPGFRSSGNSTQLTSFQQARYSDRVGLLGQWGFTCQRTGPAKAQFAIGGERQSLGTDSFDSSFELKNYCAVFASRDYRILLEHW